ncbi:MAG: hypothetical protein ACUVRD_05835 [Bacteroidia bacterium]
MRNYRELLKRKFPQNPKLGFYVHPQLPATLLGRVLVRYTHITSPAEVVALYHRERFLSSIEVVFTGTHLYDMESYFPLENLRGVESRRKDLVLGFVQGGITAPHTLRVGNETAAKILQKIFEEIIYYAPKEEFQALEKYQDLDFQSVQWLALRDEVLRTIDRLYEMYQEGKLSLIEYEEKKADLLKRL